LLRLGPVFATEVMQSYEYAIIFILIVKMKINYEEIMSAPTGVSDSFETKPKPNKSGFGIYPKMGLDLN